MNTHSPYFLRAIRLSLLIAFISIFMDAQAQIEKGRKLMEKGRYAEAVKPLMKDFSGKNQNPEAGILLAECFYELRKYPDAFDVLQSITPSDFKDADSRRFYADVLIANNDFSSAYVSLISLLSEDQSDPKTYLWLDKVSDLLAWDSLPNANTTESIAGLNTVYNDYSPYYTGDKELIFVNDANAIQAIFPSSYNSQNLHIYYKTKPRENDRYEMDRPVMLMKKRDYYFHDGPLDKWPNHAKYAFTLRKIDAPDGKIGIYFSTFSGKEEDLTPFEYNGDYNTGHPTFSEDGKRMIFSSDRSGSYGQMDLWYSDLVDGTWTEPVNMGPVINTPFNEVFPNLQENGLYYSSDRRDMGYGALDIYYSSKKMGYKEIRNIRQPINSAYDDFSMTFTDKENGYFSSNRRGGSGGDDVYGFVFMPYKETIPLSAFKMVDAEIPEGTPVTIYDSDRNEVFKTTFSSTQPIEVQNLTAGEDYTVKLGGNQALPSKAQLAILTGSGVILNSVEKNENDEFVFEATPTKATQEKAPEYGSLKYDLNGKIVADSDVAVSGIPVAVIAPGGAILATTETTEDGAFTVSGIEAGQEYTVRTEGLDDSHQVDIYGNTGAVEQSLEPTGTNRFAYTRAAPAAAWMSSAQVPVFNVTAGVSGSFTSNIEIKLYNAADSIIDRTEIQADNKLSLKKLISGKAYRLNFSGTELSSTDRLHLMNAEGDTVQTVRPFDKHNYLFEYMLNSDLGVSEPGLEEVADNAPDKSSNYKMRIDNYDLNENIPYVLRRSTGEILDTLYASGTGIIILRGLDPEVEYELTLADTTFAEDKPMQIFNEDNAVVFTGGSEKKKLFRFTLLPDENYILSKEENKDFSLLQFAMSGQMISSKEAKQLTVFTPKGKQLTTIYLDDAGGFSLNKLQSKNSYIVKSDNTDPHAQLRLYAGKSRDSLTVERSDDGNFYVNVNDPDKASIAIVDEDNSKVDVAEGAHFNLPEIFYTFNSYYLKAESRKSLDNLLVFLQDNPGVNIQILSYTDSRGPANYNKLLSQRRAESVVKYLTDHRVDASRLSSLGKGETELANKCKDGVPCSEAEHAKNRRTEFVILKGK